MIDGDRCNGYQLYCDYCGEEPDRDRFWPEEEAVEFKNNPVNRWGVVKEKTNGEWRDLCPECNTPEIKAWFENLDRNNYAGV